MSPIIAKSIPGKDGTKKKKISRNEILALPISQKCTAVYDGLADNNALSSAYAKIPTEEIIVRLFKNYGWTVIGCGQQVTRRDWLKYNANMQYATEIDKKQRMAKHYVLLRSSIPSQRILIVNGHKGNTAVKLYCGYISEDSSIYGAQFTYLTSFASIRHTADNLQNLNQLIDEFAGNLTNAVENQMKTFKETTIGKDAFDVHLDAIARIPKKPLIKSNDLIHHFYNTKQDVWGYTYYNLLKFATDTLVNHFVRSRSVKSITGLHQQAQLAMRIYEYVQTACYNKVLERIEKKLE